MNCNYGIVDTACKLSSSPTTRALAEDGGHQGEPSLSILHLYPTFSAVQEPSFCCTGPAGFAIKATTKTGEDLPISSSLSLIASHICSAGVAPVQPRLLKHIYCPKPSPAKPISTHWLLAHQSALRTHLNRNVTSFSERDKGLGSTKSPRSS